MTKEASSLENYLNDGGPRNSNLASDPVRREDRTARTARTSRFAATGVSW